MGGSIPASSHFKGLQQFRTGYLGSDKAVRAEDGTPHQSN